MATAPVPWPWLLAGGVALFLYGMRVLGEGLAAGAGSRTRHWLQGLTDRPWWGLLLGVAVTALLQSSSAVTVMILGLVHGGLLSTAAATTVIIGANIGTTITAQVIALPVDGLALPLLAVVVPIFLLGRGRPLAAVPVGFGLLLLGLAQIGAATAPLAHHAGLPTLLSRVTDRPLAALALGFITTTILDSSSGALALLQRLSEAHLLPVAAALPVIYGTNIGTTTATLAAAYTLGPAARRAAYFHVLFNCCGVLCLWPLLSLLPRWLPLLASSPARQLAHAHTLFNVAAALLFMPLRRQLLTLAEGLS